MQNITLNKLMHQIKAERGCSRQYAYILAHVILDELAVMGEVEAMDEAREYTLEKLGVKLFCR